MHPSVYICSRNIPENLLSALVGGGGNMAFCGKCGSQLHDNATFCANCGASTTAAGVTTTTPVVTTPGAPVRLEESKGFWGSLFDLSFTSFVTSKVIKFLFVLAIIVLAIGAVALWWGMR